MRPVGVLAVDELDGLGRQEPRWLGHDRQDIERGGSLTDAAQFARQASPEIWRRYLTLVLDGLAPERAGVTPLPVPALSPEEFEKTMRQNPPHGH